MLYGNHDFKALIEEVKQNSPKTEISLCPHYHEALNLMRTRLQNDDFVLIKGAVKEPLKSHSGIP